MNKLLQKLFLFIFSNRVYENERKIGYRLMFRYVPKNYIHGWVRWNMKGLWQRAGLDLEAGSTVWTIGNIINGSSSRFLKGSPEYQSWLGGYVVKAGPNTPKNLRDGAQFAMADQKSWLRSYGDPDPISTVEGWQSNKIDTIFSNGYQGSLYEFGCTTHSDVGAGYNRLWLRLESIAIAALFNLENPDLKIKSSAVRPASAGLNYETLDLFGYLAVFELAENIKVVLYANGVINQDDEKLNTFTILKDELLKAIKSCEIVKLS